jgi:hypothetical protein
MTLPARIAMKSRDTDRSGRKPRERSGSLARVIAYIPFLSEVTAKCSAARSSCNRSTIVRFDPGPKSCPRIPPEKRRIPSLLNENAH